MERLHNSDRNRTRVSQREQSSACVSRRYSETCTDRPCASRREDPTQVSSEGTVPFTHPEGAVGGRSSAMRHEKHLSFSALWLWKFKVFIQNVKQPKSRQNDANPQLSLEQLLQDKRTLKLFQDFLRSEFSDENVEFWLACEDYRSSSSADVLRRKAWGIYEKFIQPTASREINVDQRIREEIRKSLENPSVCCFDEAQKHIYMLMERDSCPRFLLSDAYLRLTHKSKTLWYI